VDPGSTQVGFSAANRLWVLVMSFVIKVLLPSLYSGQPWDSISRMGARTYHWSQ
jgi:hypothetical protein